MKTLLGLHTKGALSTWICMAGLALACKRGTCVPLTYIKVIWGSFASGLFCRPARELRWCLLSEICFSFPPLSSLSVSGRSRCWSLNYLSQWVELHASAILSSPQTPDPLSAFASAGLKRGGGERGREGEATKRCSRRCLWIFKCHCSSSILTAPISSVFLPLSLHFFSTNPSRPVDSDLCCLLQRCLKRALLNHTLTPQHTWIMHPTSHLLI